MREDQGGQDESNKDHLAGWEYHGECGESRWQASRRYYCKYGWEQLMLCNHMRISRAASPANDKLHGAKVRELQLVFPRAGRQ